MKRLTEVLNPTGRIPVLRCLAVAAMAVLLWHAEGQAQQEWGYSQYQFNLFDINGAYAGNHESASFALRYRKQWAGISGAPETQSLSIHTPVSGSTTAAGLRVRRETIGARTVFHARITGVFKVRMGDGKLGAAITAGLLHQDFNATDLNVKDENDPFLSQAIWRSNTPTVDFSLMYTSNRFYAGIESGNLNKDLFRWNESSFARLYTHLLATAGWMKKVSDNDLLQFSGLAKLSEGSVYQAEASISFLWNNQFWIGSGYRFKYGVVFFTEWNISDQWRLGYSFDLAVNQLSPYENGSHEIFLGFNLGKKHPPSIRYF